LTRHVTAIPTVQPAEIRRLTEDKAFDITQMRHLLGIEPISLAQGLAQTFAAYQES
jgi:nucleoside-diphosphate-sugar epimerase